MEIFNEKINDIRVVVEYSEFHFDYISDLFEDDIQFISNHRDYSNINTELTLDDVDQINLEIYSVFPVNAHIHSGIILSSSSFSCPWDSGVFGFLIVKKTTRPLFNLDNFLKVWNDVLSGRIFDFIVYREEKCKCCDTIKSEIIDSCCGFYGYSSEKEMISEMLDHIDIPEKTRLAFLEKVG